MRAIFITLILLIACQSIPTPAPTSSPTATNEPAVIATEWTKIEPGGATRCARDTPFAFWVRPGATDKAFIYFQGGGGCFDAESCNTTGSYDDAVTDRDDPNFTIGGVFNLESPNNPFHDHTMLFVPYCTGDVHIGNRVANYTSASGREFDIYHRGHLNASAALDWLYTNVPEPESVFVSGCSAGSIGSILQTPHIINHYPRSHVVQLGDSGGGLTSFIPWNIGSDYDAARNFPDWIPRLQDEIATTFTVSAYTAAVAQAYPSYTFAQFNSAADRIQRQYYVADGGQEAAFGEALTASLDEINTAAPNFRSYRSPGDRHCILKHATFYAETGQWGQPAGLGGRSDRWK